MTARSFHRLALFAFLGPLSIIGCGNNGCPKDLVKARGTSCSSEKKVCVENTPFLHAVACTDGRWVDSEVH